MARIKIVSYLYIPLTLLCLVSLNCAYLNTFYNAKAAFDKAFSAHMKLVHSQTDTTVEIPPEIIAGYDRTITKTAKVIDIYPKRKKRHDDAVFLGAKATFYKGEYSTAIRRFKQFQKVYPTSPFIPESYLFIGKAYLKDNSLEKAEETFRYILEKYPKLNDREEITLLLAQVSMKREGKSQAIAILEKSLLNVKSAERKIEIIIKLSGLYIDLGLFDKAIAILIRAPRNKDFQDYLFQIDYNLLICYKESGQYAKALTLVAVMLKNNHYVKQTPKVLLEKGIVYTRKAQTKEAIAVFEQITAGTGTDNDIKGRAWFELGGIYQHTMGDFEKARECYQNVISFINDERIREIAQKRIDGIDRRQTYTSAITELTKDKKLADTSDTVLMVIYSLGEIYWLNLAEPDSALVQFQSIIQDSSVKTDLLMKSMYASAWIHRFVKKDSVVADSLYHIIISRFPATITAKKAQQDLGLPVTIKTREDSAHLAFIEAERLYFSEGKTVEAVNEYYKVAKRFADVPSVASNSLYSAAWLCDHVLNKNKKALMLYRMLCKEYPESGLCLDKAKPLIKIVDDTLKILAMQKKSREKNGSIRKDGKNDSLQTEQEPEIDEDMLDGDAGTGTPDSVTTDSLSGTTAPPDSSQIMPHRGQEPSIRKRILGRRRGGVSPQTDE